MLSRSLFSLRRAGARAPSLSVFERSAVGSSYQISGRSYATASATLDQRRMVDRSGWKEAVDDDADFFIFPRERHGLDYTLNWTINRYQITPREEAYANLHLRGLCMLVKGKTDKQKRIIVDQKPPAQHDTYFLESSVDGLNPHNAKTISAEQFRYVFRDVRKHLSSQDELFVHDGAVGSLAAEVKGRIFTDSAVHALYLHHMMNKVPKVPVDAYTDLHDFSAYFTASLNDESRSHYGFSSKSFSVVDLENKRLLICGNPSTSSILEGLLSVTYLEFANKSYLSLPGDLYVNGGKSALLVSASSKFSSSKESAVECAGAAVWGTEGVYRAFSGVTYSSVPSGGNRGDLIEPHGTTTELNSSSNFFSHPDAVIFLGEGKEAASLPDLAQMNKEQAVHVFSRTNGNCALFSALLDSQNPNLFIINADNKAKSLQERISSALAGKCTNKLK